MHQFDKVSEALSLARLRAVHLRPYFATAIYRMIPVLTDEIDTLAVDQWWRLYYNAEFVAKSDILSLATSVLHETEHLLRRHHHRCQQNGYDAELFNYAGDCEINDDLKRAPDLDLIPTALLPKTFGLDDNLCAEEYYEFIKQKVIFVPVNHHNCGSAAHGKPSKGELGPPQGKSRGIGPEEGELVRSKVAEETLAYAKRYPGTVPGGLIRWAQETLSPQVPWQRVLRGMIRANVAKVAGMADYTYERSHRRQSLFPDFIIPALVEPTPNVAIIIDTSGSMETKQLAQALAEVKGVLRSTGTEQGVTVLSVDCAVHEAKRVFSPRSIKLMGGGGTDMGLGLAAAEKLRPKPDFAVVITDGYTPWPEHPPRGIQPIVVLVGDGEAPAWARTVKVAA